jgi:hypothetical protein
MIVTINTDASFSKFHKRGSFAFWIVCNDFKIIKSGILRKKVSTPSVAEFKCIINAFHILYNENLKNVSKIIVNTDCLNVIHIINNDKFYISRYRLSYLLELIKPYKNLISKYPEIKIEFRHVKAHTGVNNARSWVNEWCDTHAKLQLKKYLNL